ncbi:SH3 domain-containing protein [Mariniluteicoccus flavus]
MNVLRNARAMVGLAGATVLLTTTGIAAAVAVSQSAAADPFTVAANGGLNVRSSPSLRASIIGSLPSGARIESVGRAENGWMPIQFGNRTGWVSDSYVKAQGLGDTPAAGVPAGKGTAYTTAALNVRTGAGISFRVTTVLPKGARVTTTGVNANGYSQIVHDGAARWVSTQYLSASAAAPAAPAGPGLPAIVGTATATAELMIRTTADDRFEKIRDVPRGTVLSLTGVTQNGRTQIVFDGQVRWVNSLYLSGSNVVPRPKPTTPTVVGTKYATTALILRSSSADIFTSFGDAPAGAQLQITGVTENGRAQIVYNGDVRWVTAKYLSDQAPAPVPPSSGGVTLPGLRASTARILDATQAKYPQIRTYYGVRPDSLPDHPSGRALDIMIPSYRSNVALGDDIAQWLKANASTYNIEYVIWNQRIWSVARSSEGWRYMADRGGDTANHKDHVHVTVKS